MEIIKGSLPPTLNHRAIDRAVLEFIKETDVHGDPMGFFIQTIGSIHAAIYQNSGDFWLAVGEDGEVDSYVLGHVTKEIDNQLTYWLAQAWVNPRKRGSTWVKGNWQKVREKAKAYLCKHIVVVSARGTDAYCRFLGKGYHEYARLLKEDI